MIEGRVEPQDEVWMKRAIALAKNARRLSPPNPSVGAVIVKDGQVLGEGFTQQVGGPHAEVMALRDAAARGLSVEGATIYVTLEPCSHYGRTPPCAKALIDHRLGRVVAAITDPNPAVAGRGLSMLKAAGVEVTLGVCAREAWHMNAGFLTRMSTGRPWVRLKVAATLDGRTALNDGRSEWITGKESREDNQHWRGEAGAIVTGIGTVLADDPRMNVRLPDQKRFPLKVVVDSHLKTPERARLFDDGSTLIIAAQDPDGRAALLQARGAEVIFLPDETQEQVDLGKMLTLLAERSVNEVHLEAGATLNGAFLREGLVDEILLYTAPCFFGQGRSIADVMEPDTPGTAPRWFIWESSQVGGDLRTILLRRNP